MYQSLDFYQKEIEKLGRLNKKIGIVGSYQNHAGTDVGSSFWEVDTILKTVDPTSFGAQYDIRHAMVEGGYSWENGFELLKSLNLRDYGVTIISCPSCARQQFDVIKTVKSVEAKLAHIRKPITVSIIGCVVNGPGEATMTNIGITGGGNNTHMVYVDGEKNHRIKDESLVDYLVNIIEKKVIQLHS